MTAQAKAAERLRSVARGDLSRLGILSDMYTGVREASGLDQETYELVQIAALVAVDGSAVSWLLHLGAAEDSELDLDKVLGHAGRDRADRRHAARRLRRRQDRARGRSARRRRGSRLGLRKRRRRGARAPRRTPPTLTSSPPTGSRRDASSSQSTLPTSAKSSASPGESAAPTWRISLFEIPLSSAAKPIPAATRPGRRRRGSPPRARAGSRSNRLRRRFARRELAALP